MGSVNATIPMENNFRNIINYKYISPLTQQIQLWEVFLHLIPSWQQLFRGPRLTHTLCLGKLGKSKTIHPYLLVLHTRKV